MVAVQPEAPEPDRQAQRGLRVGAQREGERGAQVVVLGLERAQRAAAARLDRVVALGEGEAPVEVAQRQAIALARRREALGRVLADRVEQAQALVLGDHERLVDQARRQAGDAPALDRAAGAHVLGGVERERAREHRQAPEQQALLAVEQLVAPVDRRAQRLLAGERRAAAVAEDVEAVAQARGELRRA